MTPDRRSEMTDRGFLLLATLVFTFIIWSKFKVQILFALYRFKIPAAIFITGIVLTIYLWIKQRLLTLHSKRAFEREITSPTDGDDSVLAGISQRGKPVHIKLSYRRMHTQVVGTTNAGKTESVILPWAIDDIKKRRGLLIIDGKSDESLLNKLYAYAIRHEREGDVRILSICSPAISHSFNPLDGGNPLEVAERVFNALNFENEYFRSIQYDAFIHALMILEGAKVKATPVRVIELLKSHEQLKHLSQKVANPALSSWAEGFLSLPRMERELRTSGLISQLQVFAMGDTASIFNVEKSDINFEEALEQGEIIYCQLPALKIPNLGKATGKLILQCLQSAVASRHLGSAQSKEFYSVYLDDFTEYLTPSFVTLLNKSRSANVGIVFAHQALGDLDSLGDGVKNTILTNSNLKVFMRTNEPNSAEYFSQVIGTVEAAKVTERQKSGLFGAAKTGDGSVRVAEEFKYHPNLFKQDLGVGEAVIVLPHSNGSLPIRLKFRKLPDLDRPEIPTLFRQLPKPLPPIPKIETVAVRAGAVTIGAPQPTPRAYFDITPGESILQVAAQQTKEGGAA